jgi:hypothetical protein
MAPLINETDYLIVDLDGYDFFSTSNVINKTENTVTAPLHIPSTRRVSFANDVTCHDMMCRKEYTVDEMKATWYDRCSLHQMKECARSEARLAESGVLVEGGDVTLRGLESKTSKGLRRRMNAYSAVFLEIDSQQDFGMCDVEAIADAYYTYSEPCIAAAHMIAVRDAEDAKIVSQSMNMEMKFGSSLLWNLTAPACDVTPVVSSMA